MRRALPALAAVLAAALVSRAEERRSVTTFAVQDGSSFVKGKLDDTLVGPLVEASEPFDRAVVSLNADTPGDSSIEVRVRVELQGDAVTEWLSLGVVATPDDQAKLPRSAEPYKAHSAKVDIDTILLPHAKGRGLTVQLVTKRAKDGAQPRVRRVVVTAWKKGSRDPERAGAEHPAWGKVLEVVERSQRVEDPKIAGRICSATSLGMVLAYHGFDMKTVEVCAQVHDRKAEIYGNWALNVAFAGRLGLDAAVTRMGSFEPLEAEIAAGRPVVITHRWAAGELTGSPVSATDGHLIVVRGFTKEGDLVVNDPAADPRKEQKIQRVYKRAEIEKTWLGNADGVAYLVAKRSEPRRPEGAPR